VVGGKEGERGGVGGEKERQGWLAERSNEMLVVIVLQRTCYLSLYLKLFLIKVTLPFPDHLPWILPERVEVEFGESF